MAPDLHPQLRAAADAAYGGRPIALDPTAGVPTAFALQLLAAAALSLRRSGPFAGFGPAAARALAPAEGGAA